MKLLYLFIYNLMTISDFSQLLKNYIHFDRVCVFFYLHVLLQLITLGVDIFF